MLELCRVRAVIWFPVENCKLPLKNALCPLLKEKRRSVLTVKCAITWKSRLFIPKYQPLWSVCNHFDTMTIFLQYSQNLQTCPVSSQPFVLHTGRLPIYQFKPLFLPLHPILDLHLSVLYQAFYFRWCYFQTVTLYFMQSPSPDH